MKNGFLLLTALLFLPSAAMAQDDGIDSLLTYSLEVLSNMQIYSASNVLEKLSGYNVANSSDTNLEFIMADFPGL